MNRPIAVLLIVLPVLPFWGTLLSLKMEKEALKHALKQRMMETEDESCFVHLAFANEDLSVVLDWEHEDEFEYDGSMYDVVSSETRNDSTFFTLWLDREETELNRKLARLVKTKQGRSEESPPQIFLKEFKVVPPAQEVTVSMISLKSLKIISFDMKEYMSPTLSLPSPPPRV